MTDLDQAKTDSKITRRTVAKGAAWTLPVVSLAAAAPTASASPTPNPCTDCLSGEGYGFIRTVGLLPPHNVTYTGAPLLTGVRNSCKGLFSLFILGGLQSASGTTASGPVTASASGGFAGGVSIVGLDLIPFGGFATFASGTTLTELCFTFALQFKLTIGGPSQSCNVKICWKI